MAFEQALETVYRIKREYRAERDERTKLANAEVRERFAARQIPYEIPVAEGLFSGQARL